QAAAAQVDTTTATLNQVVNQTQMVELPLDGRNAAALAFLVAGTAPAPANGGGALQGITKEFPSQITVSTSGTQEDQVNYMLDGATYNDLMYSVNMPFPFPDALEEFSVQTSNYAAQYGSNSGGVVNIITKSGTNNLHGNLLEFDRNAVFNARNFFSARRDQLKRNQFGGTIGGPVVIPGVYNGKDRTFFFFGYQGTRIRNVGSVSTAYVPTQAELANGDFSAYLTASNPNNPLGKAVLLQIPGAATGTHFPGNIIPTTSFNSVALNMEKYLPQATGNGVDYYTSRTIQNQNEVVYKVDHSISSQDHLTFRGTWNHLYNDGYFDPSNLASLAGYSNLAAQDYLLHETHVFRPNLLNEFRFSYGREYVFRGPEPGAPGWPALGVQNIYDPAPNAIYAFSVTGFFSASEYPLAVFSRQNFAWADDLSWVKGAHNIQFGVSAERWRVDSINQGQAQPGFTFSPSNGTGLALANFLLGDVYQFTQQQGEPTDLRDTFIGLYAQDSFRATRRLTLNYGIRWEPGIPWNSVLPSVNYFKPSNYYAGVHSSVYTNAPVGLLFSGDSGVPGYIGFNSNMSAIMPRVGFAYDVSGNGKTSVRGGIGMFYDTRMGTSLLNTVLPGNSPYNPTLTLLTPAGPLNDPYQGVTNPFPTPVVPSKNTTFVSPLTAQTVDGSHTNEVIPLVYNWNLAVERQLTEGWLLRVAYVGNHGSHIRELAQLNPAVYATGATTSTTQARRVFQGFGSITQMTMDANSIYHGLQVSLEKRFAQGTFLHGLNLSANYTYSKAMDDVPYLAGVENTAVSAVPFWSPNRHQMDYGPSEFNHTNVLAISYKYDLPTLQHVNRYARTTFGSWEYTGVLSAYSGDPLTVLSGKDNSLTGLSEDRAVQVGSAKGPGACGTTSPCVNFLNPNSFTVNATGTYGNVGKGAFTGPNFIKWDMGVFKNFNLTEKVKLQFRAEFFNIFNRANFLDPVASVSSAGFGSIKTANDPRIGQLALKLNF
ncbi:MAG: carboxypeptidase regulatory-like domain-containing protein, partial [Acidobacteriota bacterium]|nr:carboxypeptidase regulatory-like domain-containing protein [Acidobacteriota bacterium]